MDRSKLNANSEIRDRYINEHLWQLLSTENETIFSKLKKSFENDDYFTYFYKKLVEYDIPYDSESSIILKDDGDVIVVVGEGYERKRNLYPDYDEREWISHDEREEEATEIFDTVSIIRGMGNTFEPNAKLLDSSVFVVKYLEDNSFVFEGQMYLCDKPFFYQFETH